MSMPCSIKEREYDKFQECNNKTSIRTKICQEPGEVVNVNVVEDGEDGLTINVFNTIDSLAKNTEATILQYTVPTDKIFFLKHVEVSGDNVAKYWVLINANIEGRKRTWWGKFNEEFIFNNLPVDQGISITIRVEHYSNSNGDFDARIVGNLK